MPTRVLLWPVLVQGEGAADQIARAIEGFNTLKENRPDLLIIARGGGSLEDLWAFNEEKVVRAAAASSIPLISAVGHETDTTLIDYVADWRAPTPTAAAEKAVPVKAELLAVIASLKSRGGGALGRLLEERELRFDDWSERFFNVGLAYVRQKDGFLRELGIRLRHPRQLLDQAELALHNLLRRLGFSMETYLRVREEKIFHLSQLLKSYSFEGTLQRGFALVRDEKSRLISRSAQTGPSQLLQLQFQDGSLRVRTEGKSSPSKRQSSKKENNPRTQPELPFFK